MDKEKLQAELDRRNRELLKDVRFHEEGLRFDFAEEVCKCVSSKYQLSKFQSGMYQKLMIVAETGLSPNQVTELLETKWDIPISEMSRIAFLLGKKIKIEFVDIEEIEPCEVKE